MRSYGQFCPVAKAAEIFAERWTPLVLRELVLGSRRFSDLHHGVPLMSRTLLTQRLRQLEEAGVVRSVPLASGRGREYHLTAAGEEFKEVIVGLGEWGQRWARNHVDAADLDAGLLMWDIHRRINVDRLPSRRVVARFDLRGGAPKATRAKGTWWLVLTRPEVDLCLQDPGFGVDLCVRADIVALTQVWMGDIPMAEALRSGAITLEGPRALARAFPGWLALSTLAGVLRPAPQMHRTAAARH